MLGIMTSIKDTRETAKKTCEQLMVLAEQRKAPNKLRFVITIVGVLAGIATIVGTVVYLARGK